jgi:hypothetical protein
MASGGIIDAGSGVAQTIGRYFSVVSIVPSSLYVVFVYILITSGSWVHLPRWSQAFKSLEELGVGGIGLMALASIALGVIIHPSQFAIVQFFEGYWGNNFIAQAIRSQRILRYRIQCEELEDIRGEALGRLEELGKSGSRKTVRARESEIEAAANLIALRSRYDEAHRVRESFPRALDNIMPTRLGNALRRAESQAGSQYKLRALQVVPHILLVAPQGHVDYVSDQRSQLDLAVRMTFMSVLSTATAVFFLWHCRFWIFIAVIPYMLAYFSYRGSVIAARHYGSALDILINIDRFELYKQLHLQFPTGTAEERKANEKLEQLFDYDTSATIPYSPPETSD